MTSLDECMQARKMCAHLFYLGIDDFGYILGNNDPNEIIYL